MGISIDTKPPASPISAADLLELANDPDKYRDLLAQLTELRNGQEAMARRSAEVEARERAADAKVAEAERIKSTFEAKAVKLDQVLQSQ